MRSLLALVLAACAVSPAAGFRSKHKRSSTKVVFDPKSPFPPECQALENTTIRGVLWGKPAMVLCWAWPSQFGKFPLGGAQKIMQMLEFVYGNGGLRDKIKELIKNRGKDSQFCWRALATRDVEQRMLADSALQLNTNDVKAPALANNCEMVVDGVCYGSCPRGFKPSGLMQYFRPVCDSVCADTHHRSPCGFGCAKSAFSCFRTLMDQISEVARAVGMMGSYLSGNPLIHEVVDKVLRLVELSIDMIWNIVRMAKDIWSAYTKGEGTAALLMLILSFAIEHGEAIGQQFDVLKGHFGEAMGLILEIVDAEFSWKSINLKFITDSIVKHGATILNSAFQVTQAFYYPKCQEADESVAFAIEEGDSRVMGAWTEGGVHNGRPQYTLKADENTVMVWSSSREAWHMSVNDTALYESNLDVSDYPDHGWHAVAAGEPAPRVVALKKPGQLA